MTSDSVLAAADLLSHYWSRPLEEEVETWLCADARELADEAQAALSPEGREGPRELLANAEQCSELLDEYERLFVGPGQVPCPPYESFWREDVPVDIRRTLMGPCTSELKALYSELGLKMTEGSVELPDHVAVELEALAVALSDPQAAPVAREIYDKHLRVFVPRLCRALANEAESRFYKSLAALTLDWMAGFRQFFAVGASG